MIAADGLNLEALVQVSYIIIVIVGENKPPLQTG